MPILFLLFTAMLGHLSKVMVKLFLDANLQFEYDDWLASECGIPGVEEWRKKMYNATRKNRKSRPDKYRDEWEDEDWMLEAHKDFARRCPNGVAHN